MSEENYNIRSAFYLSNAIAGLGQIFALVTKIGLKTVINSSEN